MPLVSICHAQYIAAQPRSMTVHAELVLLYILGLEAVDDAVSLGLRDIKGFDLLRVFRAPPACTRLVNRIWTTPRGASVIRS